MQGNNDRPNGVIRHFHKAKAAALVSLLVKPNAGANDLAERFYEFRQIGGSRGKRQVTKIQYLAHIPRFSVMAVYPDCGGCASYFYGRRYCLTTGSSPAWIRHSKVNYDGKLSAQ